MCGILRTTIYLLVMVNGILQTHFSCRYTLYMVFCRTLSAYPGQISYHACIRFGRRYHPPSYDIFQNTTLFVCIIRTIYGILHISLDVVCTVLTIFGIHQNSPPVVVIILTIEDILQAHSSDFGTILNVYGMVFCNLLLYCWYS